MKVQKIELVASQSMLSFTHSLTLMAEAYRKKGFYIESMCPFRTQDGLWMNFYAVVIFCKEKK